MSPPRLTLASSSPYRRKLLEQLGLSFDCESPAIDESARPGETPAQLVTRLAREKAAAVIARHSDARLVIASDQVACLDGEILTKPGNLDTATLQLGRCSGRCVTFFTSLALVNSANDHWQTAVETTEVSFRELDEGQINRYLIRETPFDCAGSFKVEGLGISLFTAIHGDDPNSLIGLPLIRLVAFLENQGLRLP